jgi:hypothetical protein
LNRILMLLEPLLQLLVLPQIQPHFHAIMHFYRDVIPDI